METKESIKIAARDLFLEKGPMGLTMRGVAERVGISPTAIYRHFRNKDELIMSVVHHGFSLFGSYMYKSLEFSGAGERLLQTGLGYIEFGIENPEYYRLIHMSRERFSPEFHCHEPGVGDTTFQFLLDRIRQCQQEGLIDPSVGVMEAGLYLWSQVHGLTTFIITGGLPGIREPEQFLEVARSIIERSIRGLQ